jgi:hypothetical protein
VPFEQKPPRAPKPPRVRSTLDRKGWYRKPLHDNRDPMWAVIADRAQQPIELVWAVRDHLRDLAFVARDGGKCHGYQARQCAKDCNNAPETAVRDVVAAMMVEGWFSEKFEIVSWSLEQPDKEDPTAAQRQRNRRRRIEALERAEGGVATPEDLELLTAQERQVCAEIAARSRVTLHHIEEKPERIAPFRPVVAKEESFAAREIAAQENQAAARRWLVGDNTTVHGYGTASLIIKDNWRCTRMTADSMIRQWLEQAFYEAPVLASFISGPFEQGLTGESYQRVVEGSIATFIEERTSGPKLPFRPVIQRGGAA